MADYIKENRLFFGVVVFLLVANSVVRSYAITDENKKNARFFEGGKGGGASLASRTGTYYKTLVKVLHENEAAFAGGLAERQLAGVGGTIKKGAYIPTVVRVQLESRREEIRGYLDDAADRLTFRASSPEFVWTKESKQTLSQAYNRAYRNLRDQVGRSIKFNFDPEHLSLGVSNASQPADKEVPAALQAINLVSLIIAAVDNDPTLKDSIYNIESIQVSSSATRRRARQSRFSYPRVRRKKTTKVERLPLVQKRKVTIEFLSTQDGAYAMLAFLLADVKGEEVNKHLSIEEFELIKDGLEKESSDLGRVRIVCAMNTFNPDLLDDGDN